MDLSALDGDSKITIVEEDFHQSEVAIENDNFERNFLKMNALMTGFLVSTQTKC